MEANSSQLLGLLSEYRITNCERGPPQKHVRYLSTNPKK